MMNFHPHVVHFPVAITFVLFFYEFWSLFAKKEPAPSARTFLLVFLLLGALAAVGTGWWYEEFMPHPHEGEVHEIMERHEFSGFVALGGVVLLNVLNWFSQRRPTPFRKIYLLLLAIAVLLVDYQGYLGGELGHTHGLSLPADQHPPMHLHEHRH